jgi:membrane associated rhomboid family serine protease
MIIIPTGTDAPIYHWPYATVGLIVLNVALAFIVPPVPSAPDLDEEGEVVENVEHVSNFDRYALAIGDGRLHPVQWVTHNFLHYGLIHLAGNMLFLWAFGIVVEGKLGAVKYLLAYLAIGTLHGACTQILLVKSGLGAHAAGASAAVYGLLAVCMVWAPRNELNCLAIILVGFRTFVFHWDLYYTTVALLYVGEQLFGLVFWGSMGGKVMLTELGHLSGAFWGAVVAIIMLKAGLVDCEQWDMFSLWTKRQKLAADWKKRGKRLDHEKMVERSSVKARARRKRSRQKREGGAEAPAPSQEERSAAAVRRVESLIENGDIPGALAAYDKAARILFDWPSQPDLAALIKAMHARGALAESIRLMREHCQCFPQESSVMRLKLAQILIRDGQRPVAALRVLEEIPAGALAPELESAREKLARKAKRMVQEGVLELEGDDA